jgi:hypothetical protein
VLKDILRVLVRSAVSGDFIATSGVTNRSDQRGCITQPESLKGLSKLCLGIPEALSRVQDDKSHVSEKAALGQTHYQA